MRWTLCLLALAACSAPSSTEDPGVLSGAVVSVDASPLAYDGDALVEVRTDAGQVVTVRIPARMNLCEAEGLGQLDDLGEGTRIDVRGAVGDDGDVTPCTEPTHYLRIVS